MDENPEAEPDEFEEKQKEVNYSTNNLDIMCHSRHSCTKYPSNFFRSSLLFFERRSRRSPTPSCASSTSPRARAAPAAAAAATTMRTTTSVTTSFKLKLKVFRGVTRFGILQHDHRRIEKRKKQDNSSQQHPTTKQTTQPGEEEKGFLRISAARPAPTHGPWQRRRPCGGCSKTNSSRVVFVRN